MIKKLFIVCLLSYSSSLFAQELSAIITNKEVERIEATLCADDMQGRKVFTPGIDKAADFIYNEFKLTGLETLKGLKDYRQSFIMLEPKQLSFDGNVNAQSIPSTDVIIATTKADLDVNEQSSFEKVSLLTGKKFFSNAYELIRSGKNYVVFVDGSLRDRFNVLQNLIKQIWPSNGTVIFILGNGKIAKKYGIKTSYTFDTVKLANIVGVLPGNTKPQEYVVFSAHYDHLGIGQPVNNDSIYNGANDDAAGTTAIIMLAKYFKALHNNARTLVFIAFTAEEIGGFGSQYFSRRVDPTSVKAMFNIEMIGTESKWGKGSAYITGYDKSDMGKILQKNLEGTGFNFYPDPYLAENLFYRSDNATLAQLGVPAHTISTSKMDDEPNYHKASDELNTLDIANMVTIIRAIALSSKTIVSGKDTPSRINYKERK